jgi:hypothetical protein
MDVTISSARPAQAAPPALEAAAAVWHCRIEVGRYSRSARR